MVVKIGAAQPWRLLQWAVSFFEKVTAPTILIPVPYKLFLVDVEVWPVIETTFAVGYIRNFIPVGIEINVSVGFNGPGHKLLALHCAVQYNGLHWLSRYGMYNSKSHVRVD